MSENLGYPFKHHTKLKDVCFLFTRENMKPDFKKVSDETKKLSMYYRNGLLSFMDDSSKLPGLSGKNVSPETAARLNRLMESDETALYFQPCYNFRLFIDFCEIAPLISDEMRSSFMKRYYDWHFMFVHLNWAILVLYSAAYNKEHAFTESMYADLEKYEKDYLMLAGADGKDLLPSKLIERFDAARDDETKFLLNEYIVTSLSRNLARSKDEICSAAQELLVSRLMEGILATDDEETRSSLNQYVAAFFSREFPEICKVMRSYYARVHEISMDILYSDTRK